jgi:hypothetical protein
VLVLRHNQRMPTLDLTDEEHAVVTALVRQTIAEDKFPLSPRLKPLKAALAKLDPQPAKPRRELAPLPTGPMVGSRRKACGSPRFSPNGRFRPASGRAIVVTGSAGCAPFRPLPPVGSYRHGEQRCSLIATFN